MVPVVYLDETQRGAACAEALTAAALIGEELELPVFLYGELATRPEHVERAYLRARRPGRSWPSAWPRASWCPTTGPRAPHPTAGAVLVTARPPLVAFNVDLATDDVEVAQRIAASLRESGGGLPGVRALGLFLAERGRAQVSTNVHDHRAVPLRRDRRARARARPRWPRPSWWASRRGPRSRAFPTTCRCAASRPSAT